MKEEEIINILRDENKDYKKLEEDHKKLDQVLDDMNKKKYLTPKEEIEKKRIQKQKLHYKDLMADLVRTYTEN